MRIRWRDFELPIRVVHNIETATPVYGEFIAEPFERGFGHTIGNSLRRALLSAIEGCAVTSIKIEGVKHEFSTLPSVVEDVSDIILNVKKIRLNIQDETSAKLYIDVNKKGKITAGEIEANDNVSICNKDMVIATLSSPVNFQMEMEAKKGRGYLTAEDNAQSQQELGTIPVASIFSPVNHVHYKVENTRVGKITNYDRVLLYITTDGTISPEMALVEASKILRKHLNPFIQYFELGKEVPGEPLITEPQPEKSDKNQEVFLEKLDTSIESMKLGVRASNCLSSEGMRTVGDLVIRSESELLKIRNFGKTSLNEIKAKLQKLNLSLGMTLEE